MAESHVITGLVAKRAEMIGRLAHYRKEIQRLEGGLTHLDATIKLFSPEFDLRSVRPKEHRERNQYFGPGECQRLILEIFREAGGTVSSRRIAEELVRRKEFESTEELISLIQKTAGAILRQLEKKEVIRPAGRTSLGITWELVS